MEVPGFRITPLKPQDYHSAFLLNLEQGWLHTESDMVNFTAEDPESWLAGYLNDELVTVICAAVYGDTFAHIGCFVTKADHRGKGFGTAVLAKALEHTGSRCTALIPVAKMVETYRRFGFVKVPASIKPFSRNSTEYKINIPDTKNAFQYVKFTNVDFGEFCAFDRKYFPTSREKFLQKWMIQEDGVNVICKLDEKIVGYGVARCEGEGAWRVGPLFADDAVFAADIWHRICQNIPTPWKAHIDVWNCETENKREWIKLCGFPENHQDSYSVMLRNSDSLPTFSTDGVYGITTLDIG